MFISSCLIVIPVYFTYLVIIKGMYGMTMGVLTPIIYNFVAEITPLVYRGRILFCSWVFFSVGEV